MEDTGVYSRKALIRSGLSQADINELVQRGMFFSVIRGWYAVPEADRHLIEALQTGTRIGCLTGCRYHSLWTPRNAGLHLTYRDGPKPTRPSRATIHRYNHPLPESVVWPLHDCLLHVLRNHDLETSLIVIESAINKALLTFAEARELIGNGPKELIIWPDTFIGPNPEARPAYVTSLNAAELKCRLRFSCHRLIEPTCSSAINSSLSVTAMPITRHRSPTRMIAAEISSHVTSAIRLFGSVIRKSGSIGLQRSKVCCNTFGIAFTGADGDKREGAQLGICQ